PARSTFTLPVFANKCAVETTCSSVSALHGPAMIKGLSPVSNQYFKGTMSNVCFIFFMKFFMFSLFILTPILSLVRVEAQQRRGSNHISPPLEGSGEDYTFSFLIYSPMMVKLIVCFSTFRIAAS